MTLFLYPSFRIDGGGAEDQGRWTGRLADGVSSGEGGLDLPAKCARKYLTVELDPHTHRQASSCTSGAGPAKLTAWTRGVRNTLCARQAGRPQRKGRVG